MRHCNDGADAFIRELASMPVADMRQHHDSRALIDPVGKVLRRDEPRLVFRHVLDDSPATLLRVPDLPAGREFVVAYENPVATAGKIERRRTRVDTGREIGSAACRERGCTDVEIWGVA